MRHCLWRRYTDFNLINRASKVADSLRIREPSWLPAATAAALHRPVISLGGGPAFDLAALAVLRSFVEMAACPPTNGGLDPRHASRPDAAGRAPGCDDEHASGLGSDHGADQLPDRGSKLCVHVLDYEPRWSSAAAAVRSAVENVLDTQYEMHFGRCDVTKTLASPVNAAVCAALPDSRLLIASYVVCENAKALDECDYALFADVMAEAQPETMLLVLETTHRQFPKLVAAARRGIEIGNGARGEECSLRVAIPDAKGRGGSQCILLKEASGGAQETREQLHDRALQGNQVMQTLKRFAVNDVRHRREGRRMRADRGGPHRRSF